MCQVNSQMANYRNSATYSYKQQRISNKHEGSKQKTLKQLIIGTCCNELLFVMTSQPHSDLDRLIVKFPWSHSDTPQSVGLLWRSDRRVAETSTWQHTTFTTDIPAPRGIRTRNPGRLAAADPCLRPRGNCSEQMIISNLTKCEICSFLNTSNSAPVCGSFSHLLR